MDMVGKNDIPPKSLPLKITQFLGTRTHNTIRRRDVCSLRLSFGLGPVCKNT